MGLSKLRVLFYLPSGGNDFPWIPCLFYSVLWKEERDRVVGREKMVEEEDKGE